MQWRNWFSGLYRGGGRDAEPIKPIRLDASTEALLADSLRRLPLGQRGWITIEEARRLFSSKAEDDNDALTKWDPEGVRRLSEFAVERHRSTPLQKGGRLFFRRRAY